MSRGLITLRDPIVRLIPPMATPDPAAPEPEPEAPTDAVEPAFPAEVGALDLSVHQLRVLEFQRHRAERGDFEDDR